MEEKNSVNISLKKVFLLFCLVQLILDGFLIFTIFNQSNRLDVHDNLISDFVEAGKTLQGIVFNLIGYHNKLVESSFISNKKIEITTNNFFTAMRDQTTSEFNDCIARFDNPMILEEPALVENATMLTGYKIHLYDSTSFKEIGYAIFAEDYVDYNIFDCGRAFYNETIKRLDIEMV